MRSDYSQDESYPGQFGMWRGQVNSAIRGKRGQAFLRELIDALDTIPDKRLIAEELRADGEVCALGSLGAKRGLDLESLDVEDYHKLADVFGIAHQLIQEIESINDDDFGIELNESNTPEQRWKRVRAWAQSKLILPTGNPAAAKGV